MIEEYHTVRANMDREAAAARAHTYESGRRYITDRIVRFIANLYLNITEYKRAKDNRFNNWQEIVEDIKDIVITRLARSKDARLMGEGISAQFNGLTTWQLMDHTLVYYHIANMDKLLNLLTERHAMMILSLTSLTQREYEDVVMMFVANPDISMDRNDWHTHWGLPNPEDEPGKAGFWKQVLGQVDDYVQRTETKPL